MSRIKGNTQPLLTFKVGSGSAVDLGPDLVSIEFADSDGNQVTMADYASGDAGVTMNMTFALDFGVTNAYEFLYANAGKTGVTYVYQQSNATASQTNPKFTGTCTLGVKPRFQVQAGTDVTTFDTSAVTDSWSKAIV